MKWLASLLLLISCSDTIVEVERNYINAEESIPFFFGAEAEQGYSENRWTPVYYYYIYQIEEGEYDAYFHCYLMNGDSVLYSGMTKVYPEYGKTVYGEFKPQVDFPSFGMVNVIPMAMIKVEGEY